jgi:heat shock protein HslJ
MKALAHLFTLVIAVLLIVSCGPTKVATTSNSMYERDALYANSWDLVELNGTPITRSGNSYSYITFTPNSNRISGYTTCNYIGGKISLSGANGITVTPVRTTNNTCTGNSLDVSLIPALQGVTSWSMDNNKLVLYKNNKVVARLAPATYKNDRLYGTWQLAYINENSVPFDVLYPVDRRPTLVFTSGKNVVTGTTGYNTFNCPVYINSNGITFTDCTATKMAYEGKGEPVYLSNLRNINNYSLMDDDTLVLYTDGNTVLKYTRIK